MVDGSTVTGQLGFDAGSNPGNASTDVRGSGFVATLAAGPIWGRNENHRWAGASSKTAPNVTMSDSNGATPWQAPTLSATDPDLSTVSVLLWSVSSAPANGSASFSNNTNAASLTYAPDAGFSGADSFVVRVSDGLFHDTITINVTVEATHTNLPPVISGNSTVIMSEDASPTAFRISLSANDPDNDALTWSMISQATKQRRDHQRWPRRTDNPLSTN